MKNKKKEQELVNVMIGGGDESIIIKVPKGKKILTSYGYIIAGETYEENIKRHEDKWDALSKAWKEETEKYEKYLLKKQKPDFRTWLSIKMMNGKIVAHPDVFRANLSEKCKMSINEINPHEVYVFNSHQEFKFYFLMYLNSVNTKEIDSAICIWGKKGQIVAYKGLCEQIIVKKATEEFYASIKQDKIDEIHANGKLTPSEAVEEYESFDLCVPGNAIGSAGYRCDFFGVNCHECLREYASHTLEHDKIDFKLINLDQPGRTRNRNNKKRN